MQETAIPTILRRLYNMKHIYITNCSPDGGIYHYTLNGEKLVFCDKLTLDRPMYTVIKNNKAYILLRDSGNGNGGLITCGIDKNGMFHKDSEALSSKGIVPCHLCVGNDNTVYIVNYLSGNIVKMPDREVKHKGMGVNLPRQDSAHTHFAAFSPDGNYILCTDLGLDTVFVYDSELNEVSKENVPSGSGCRHLVFSKNGKYVYCVNELSNNVSVLSFNLGKLKLLDTVEAIPEFKGKSTAAAIRLKDGYLYVSHRGADCISRFKAENERLTLLDNTPCGGVDPRDFDITDNLLICANEGGNVSVLRLENSKPEFIYSFDLKGDPLCVSFYEN